MIKKLFFFTLIVVGLNSIELYSKSTANKLIIEEPNFAITATYTTVNSICLNSGMATINATGGTGVYTYSFISTPSGFSATSIVMNGNTFSGLAIGNYQVKVMDTNGESIMVSFAIGGVPYQNMEPTATYDWVCTGVELRIAVTKGIGPYTYTLVSGPGITSETPRQTTNKFIVQQAGTYRYRVYDSCGAFQTRTLVSDKSFVLSDFVFNNSIGNYFASTQTLSCVNGNLALTVRLGYPRNITTPGVSYPAFVYPYNYTININNGQEILTGSIPNDLFIPLTIHNFNPTTPYNYTITLTNACSVSKSFSGIINPKVTINLSNNCDNPGITTDGAFMKSGPVTYELLDNLNNVVATNTLPHFYKQDFPQMMAGESYKIRVNNSCGFVESEYLVLNGSKQVEVVNNNCVPGYRACGYNLYNTANYQFVLYRSNNLVAPIVTKLGNQDNGIFFNSDSPLIVVGQSYVIKVTNLTNNDTFTTVPFFWTVSNNFQQSINVINKYGNWPAGIIGVGNVTFNYNRISDITSAYPISVSIINGPSSFTRRDGTVINLTYPMVLSTNTIGKSFDRSLPLGTYTIQVTETDPCIPSYTQNIDITPSLVQEQAVIKNFNLEYINQCAVGTTTIKFNYDSIKPAVNANALKYYYCKMYVRNTSTNAYFMSAPLAATANTGGSVSIPNIPNGTYEAGMIYTDHGGRREYFAPLTTYFADLDPIEIITLGGYTQPEIKNLIVSECADGLRNIVVEAYPNKGVAPYKYKIISGPNGFSTAQQTSPEFYGLVGGLYQFQLEDSCGNAVTTYLEVSNFIPPAFNAVGETCSGQSVTFSFPDVDYYQYTWTLPNQTTVVGNELSLTNLSSTDYGSYTVKIESTVGGCTSNVIQNYYLEPCRGLQPIPKYGRVNPGLRMRVSQ